MRSISDILGEYALFDGMPSDMLELIAGCGQNVHFDAGSRIIAADEPADVFYVLRTGHVAIEIDTPRRGPLLIESIGPGDLLGVSWLLPPFRWTFGARALDATSAIAVDAACLRTKCDSDPALGYELFKRFAGVVRDRLQAARLQLIDVYGNDAS